jgi:Rrf2 family transcriptional regulator, iron-sulfur cluster assembly transcription factor
MLALTRKTEYALIAVCHLAQVGDKVVSARDIAEEHAVPLPLLMNVLKRLNRTGHVRSIRGAHGGYVLGKRPEEITLADLIGAVEGPVHLTRCTNPDQDARPCARTGICFIRRPVATVHEHLSQFLAGITVAEIAFDARTIPVEAAKVIAR